MGDEGGAQRVAILTIGSELLRGDGLDTNSQWLSRRVERLGLQVHRHASCPDVLEQIVDELAFSARGAEVLIVTGGLGPTRDDLTRAAVARWAGVELELHEPSLRHIEALFRRFGRDMPDSNRVQAELPQGARALTNEVGTATCFALEQDGCLVYALPGVPREVRWLWDAYLRPELGARAQRPQLAERTFRTVGISESALGEALAPVEARAGVEVRYAAEESKGTIRVTLLTADEAAAQDAWQEARALVGDHVAALGNDELPVALVALLRAAGLKAATAESCTGGRVAAAITGVPGSSWVFEEGFVTYSNGAKTARLGVPEETLADHGAVSREVAEAMARGVRERTGADLGVGVTGIAGPGGGSDAKPVGLVHFAVAGPGPDDLRHKQRRFPGTRDLVQTRATAAALDLLRQAALERLPASPPWTV
jgi:nicotinamide-nucleotide amidase